MAFTDIRSTGAQAPTKSVLPIGSGVNFLALSPTISSVNQIVSIFLQTVSLTDPLLEIAEVYDDGEGGIRVNFTSTTTSSNYSVHLTYNP